MKIVRRVTVRFFQERFFDHAAQTAYYLLFAMIPIMILLFSLLSYLPVNEQVILAFIRPFAPAQAYEIIKQHVQVVSYKVQGNVLYTSLIASFWISSVAVQSLARSLDAAYGIVRTAPFWRLIVRDLGVTFLFMIVMSLSFFLPIIESMLYRIITYYDVVEDWKGWLYLWPVIKWGMGTLFLFLFFHLFFQVVPTKRMKGKEVLPGACFSTLGWQLFSYLFGHYVATANYTQLYGQLSGIILLVLWFYLTAIILLFSGLLNAEWGKVSQRKRGRI